MLRSEFLKNIYCYPGTNSKISVMLTEHELRDRIKFEPQSLVHVLTLRNLFEYFEKREIQGFIGNNAFL